MLKKIVFSALISTGLIQAQSWELVNNEIIGEKTFDQSGFAVSLNAQGSIIAVGSPLADLTGNDNVGEVNIYENSSGNWSLIGNTIKGEAIDGRLGSAVSLNADGTILAIGAPFSDDSGKLDNGKVQVFENNSGIWTQLGNTIQGEFAKYFFGSSVSLSNDGNILAVGAPGEIDPINGNNDTAGELRIFRNEGDIWTQIGSTLSGAATGNLFGISVSLNQDGSIVAVGEPRNGENAFTGGKVSIYKNESDAWNLIGDSFETNNFSGIGSSINLNDAGNVIAISGFTSETKIYKNDTTNWTLVGSAIPAPGNGLLGSSVSLNAEGTIVAIGDPGNPSNGNNDAGIVRVFENIGDVWMQVENDIEGVSEDDELGRSVSLNAAGDILAIGTPNFDNNSTLNIGQVAIFTNNQAVLSINDVKDISSDLIVYPNPTSESVLINTNGVQINEVVVRNLQGTPLLKENSLDTDSVSLPVSNLASGTYLVSIVTDKGDITKLFVKE
ncbi:T9SS type A sorting domain-containing protein [Aquimarina agarivorans]|uniref:T9SS type A sorting domain-containing protein n=1 Tax=Aquimarina agarivorans TaxID=980584 RepID=UPI00031DFD87|nr:T9SS type A sorting domain-containing protein [Aquimarina agarivorans]